MTNTVHREFLELGSCSSTTALESRLVAMGQLLEFEIATAAVAVDRPGRQPYFRMIGNAPAAWRSVAGEPSFVRRDPVLKRLRASSVPFIYDQAMYVNEGVGDLWEMQAPYGFKTGIAMAMHLPGGKHFLLGLDRERPLPVSAEGASRIASDVALLTIYAQEAAVRILLEESPAPASMSSDSAQRDGPTESWYGPESLSDLDRTDLEILSWAASGKSSWTIGMLLNLSESIVHRRMQRVRKRLGVATRQQAVARAVALGLVKL